MLKGKQRSYLKSLANPLKATIIVGKQGVTDTVLQQLEDQLNANELVKITFLETSAEHPRDVAHALADRVGAEFISQLGNKLVLYRPAETPKIELPR